MSPIDFVRILICESLGGVFGLCAVARLQGGKVSISMGIAALDPSSLRQLARVCKASLEQTFASPNFVRWEYRCSLAAVLEIRIVVMVIHALRRYGR